VNSRWTLPWSFSTFDYRELCSLMWQQAECPEIELDTALVTGRSGNTVHTDRGDLTAPLIVDALGWRRVLSRGVPIQPPNARLSRGLEVHPPGEGPDLELWIDPRYVRAGYAWNFPARDELRVGVGSFWPAHHVKEPTVRLAGELGLPPEGYQGNWIPHQLRPAVEDGVFFAGDSAGHCLPLTAEGIRTALYFGLACGRQLRAVLDRRATREQALRRYGAFSDAHARKYACLLAAQRAAGRLTPSRALSGLVRALESRPVASWIFKQYLEIAPPSFVAEGPRRRLARTLAAAPA
jgi:flavin-dependent dehydrogenase